MYKTNTQTFNDFDIMNFIDGTDVFNSSFIWNLNKQSKNIPTATAQSIDLTPDRLSYYFYGNFHHTGLIAYLNESLGFGANIKLIDKRTLTNLIRDS